MWPSHTNCAEFRVLLGIIYNELLGMKLIQRYFMNDNGSVFIERIARFALGEPIDNDLKIERSMGKLGLCAETQAIMRLTNVILKDLPM